MWGGGESPPNRVVAGLDLAIHVFVVKPGDDA